MNEKLKAFVGHDRYEDYYKGKWQKEYSWNWVAFFFTVPWLGYRKMFGQIFAIVALYLITDFIFYLTADEDTIDLLGAIIGLIVSFIYGFLGNKMYKNKAEKTITHISKLNYSEDDELNEISKKGGASSGGIFTSIGIYILYFLASLVLYNIVI
ncbi:DUF2628 domain-containing protein [Cytobacillus gottheilii]|uniref:DUF2628 domain-containing protein n=1 Tax=Cytobacillus gottheilii TaxID=859144 RepID=UPI0015930B44|nr:DUF2628 domain-containing protein [Cytobacillus gottheilii]